MRRSAVTQAIYWSVLSISFFNSDSSSFFILLLPIFVHSFVFVFRRRYYCETGDVQGTLGKMPGYKVREMLVLKALHRHGTDMVCMEEETLFVSFNSVFLLNQNQTGVPFFCKK